MKYFMEIKMDFFFSGFLQNLSLFGAWDMVNKVSCFLWEYDS